MKTYSTEQLKELLELFCEVSDSRFYESGIKRFIKMIEVREIKLPRLRDKTGKYITPVSNEEIMEFLKGFKK